MIFSFHGGEVGHVAYVVDGSEYTVRLGRWFNILRSGLIFVCSACPLWGLFSCSLFFSGKYHFFITQFLYLIYLASVRMGAERRHPKSHLTERHPVVRGTSLAKSPCTISWFGESRHGDCLALLAVRSIRRGAFHVHRRHRLALLTPYGRWADGLEASRRLQAAGHSLTTLGTLNSTS